MMKWDLVSASPPPKPKPIEHVTQQLACIYSRLNCMSKIDGLGCLKCARIFLTYKEDNSYTRSIFGSNLNCTCDIYECNYTVLYHYDHTAKLVMQSKNEREDKRSGKK